MTPKLSNNHCQTDDVIFLPKKRHFWCQKNVKSYQTVTARLFLDFRFGYKMETNEIKFKFSFQECPKFLSAAIGQKPRNYSRCCCCSFPFVSFLLQKKLKWKKFCLSWNQTGVILNSIQALYQLSYSIIVSHSMENYLFNLRVSKTTQQTPRQSWL